MQLDRIPVYVVLAFCLITAYILFSVKDKVMSLRAELKQVKTQIQYEQDSIHILKAELAYLSSHERITKLAKNYLKLKGTKVAQMIIDPASDREVDSDRKMVNTRIVSKNVRWRYKKGPSKYLTTVSARK